MDGETEPVRLLWTGGWDSTYRLIDLVLVQGRAVEPHYLRDERRRSTPKELETMDAIRQRLDQGDGLGRLVRPTVIADVSKIPPNEAITAAFERLRSAWGIGTQYEWLARYAVANGVRGLELAIHRDDRAHAAVTRFGREASQQSSPADGTAEERSDQRLVFGPFRYPLLDLTKTEMARVAAETGFGDLMALTWFCHHPTRRGEPCGSCNPCRYTISEGLAWRIPLRNRLRSRLVETARRTPLPRRIVRAIERRVLP